MQNKKLYKDKSNGKVAGVCAGLAEYMNIDVTIVRILMLVFAIVGWGLLFYIVAAIVMPDKPLSDIDQKKES